MRRPSLSLVYLAALALLGWVAGFWPLHDNSFLWHLRTGQLILDEGIPRADPFSWAAQGTTWVAQSWLAEVVYALLERLGGPFAIRLFSATLAAFVVGGIFLIALRLSGERARAAGMTIAAFACLFFFFISTRPLLIGLVLLMVLVRVVEIPDSWTGRHELVVVPVALWIWANVHGTWTLGVIYVGLHLVGRWSEGLPPWHGRERRLLLAGAIGGLATFVNPYGWRLVLFPLELLGRGENLRMLSEWQSPDFTTAIGLTFAAWMALFVVVGARRGLMRRDLVVALPFLFLALWSLRNIPIAVLVTVPIAARAIATSPGRAASARVVLLEPAQRPDGPRPLNVRGLVLVTVMLLAVGVVFAAATEDDFSFDAYPVATIEEVESAGLGGRRWLTREATAGYLILTRWPDQMVFVDDRVDMYPPDVRDAYVTFLRGREGWNEELGRFDVEVVVWPVDSPLGQLLDESPQWQRLVDEEDGSAAWVPTP